MSNPKEEENELPIKKLVVDASSFNDLVTALVMLIEEGADSAEVCIDERSLECGKKRQITLKVEASNLLGEFDNELSPSSIYSCIHLEH
tara:strand:- start:34171 stop:34437 length:267 start_codon:yes stop_codon:yes gene_type:complete